MRRFPTVIGLGLLVGLVIAGWYWLQDQTPRVSAENTPLKVRITNVADNKFSVSWTTHGPSTGTVEYGPVGEKLTQIVTDDRDKQGAVQQYVTHHVTVAELQPETQYAFRIVSQGTRFDNNGSPYAVSTGPTIAQTPPAKSFYGDIEESDALHDSIVYLALPGAAPVSTMVTSSNNYSFSVSTIRTSDLSSYISYDAQATIATVTVENGLGETQVVVTTANSEPVPTIILGQNADYRTAAVPPVAQVEPLADASPLPTDLPVASPPQTPGIFNVQPLNSGSTQTPDDVELINPARDGETLATQRPEFRGVGPKATVISITVHSTTPYADNISIDPDGTWNWTPPANLEPGEHTITIAYIDTAGVEQTLKRTFFVSPVLAAEGDPAFVSTPSGSQASPTPTASPRISPSPTRSSSPTASSLASPAASAREIMPSTESGVPVTGIMTPTLLTAALGFVIMVTGVLLLAL